MSGCQYTLFFAVCWSLAAAAAVGSEPNRNPDAAPAAKNEKERLDAYGDPLPPGAFARLGTVRLRHAGTVHCLAFSPNGKTLASGGGDQAVRLWDVETGKSLRQFPGLPGDVTGVLFSLDGKSIVSASQVYKGGAATRWSVADGRELRTYRGVTNLTCLALSPDGKTLAAGGLDGPVELWDFETGESTGRLKDKFTQRVVSLAFSPDSQVIAAISYERGCELWDWKAGQRLRTLSGRFRSAAFAQDGKTLAAKEDLGFSLWDVGEGKLVRRLGDKAGWGWGFAVSPDGGAIAEVENETVHVWQPTTGKELCRLEGHADWIRAVAFSPDGKRLAAAGENRTIRIWDLASHKQIHPFASEPGGLVDAQFIGDSARLAVRHSFEGVACSVATTITGPGKLTLRFWEPGKTGAAVSEARTYEGRAALISPDGNRLIRPGDDRDGTLQVHDAKTGKELLRFGRHGDYFEARPIALSGDGKVLAAVSDEMGPVMRNGINYYHVRLWDVGSGKALAALTRPFGQDTFIWVSAAAFTPDGKVLALAARRDLSSDGRVSLWDVAKALGSLVSMTARLIQLQRQELRLCSEQTNRKCSCCKSFPVMLLLS
jgi:WD40 repeat protein